jgi:hypothetical protein
MPKESQNRWMNLRRMLLAPEMIAKVLIMIGVGVLIIGVPSRSVSEPPPPRDLSDVVSWSDVIVLGTLSGVVQESRDGSDYAEGTIHVSEVLWGPIIPENRLLLQWSNPFSMTCPRTEHVHRTERGIWLLEMLQDGTVRACDPDCFQPEHLRDGIRTLLNDNTLVAKVVTSTTAWPWLNIRIRNSTADTLVLPGLRKDGRILILDPRVELEVNVDSGGQGDRLSPLPGRLRRDPSIPPIAVPPQTDHTLLIQLANIFPLKPRHRYSFSLSIPKVRPRVVEKFYTSDCLPQ